ncbi:MAG: phosphatidylserine/phosphatidylglycerophosphate/cardiolipin synthase family protein [Acidiferrobacterales bacterium]
MSKHISDSHLAAGGYRGRRGQQHIARAVCALALALFAGTCAADVFRLIDSDQDAAQVRVDMIERARAEILLSLHRASDDYLVLSYLALLRKAARRGVKVRFLIDSAFNELSKGIQAQLLAAGIEIKEYHPVRVTRIRWTNQRLHDKMIVTDRTHLLLGGRNLENPFFGITKKSYAKKLYVDRDAYVRGEAAALAAEYFMELWHSKEVFDVSLGTYDPKSAQQTCDTSLDDVSYELCTELHSWTRTNMDRASAAMESNLAELKQSRFVHLNPGKDWSAGQREDVDVRFLHDPIGRKGIEPGTFETFLDYVNRAERSIAIESPYLILSDNSQEVLRRAIKRGVRVRVLTNSLASTQNLFAQGGYEGKKADLVQMGLEIWEFKGPKMLHAKSVVIDDEIALVGNFNIDPRSEFYNTELAVVARDQRLARQLRSSMDANLENAWLIGPDAKPIGESERFPGASAGKIFKLRLYQLVAPAIRNQL